MSSPADEIGFPFELLIPITIIGIIGLLELGVIVYSFVNADELYCDLWHCGAKKLVSSNTNIIQNQSCSMNGEPIDCNTINNNWIKQIEGVDER